MSNDARRYFRGRARSAQGMGTRTYPFWFLSMIPGIMECAYALVQIRRRITRRSDWKLKSAVWSMRSA